jgi:hypothetical protein
VWHGSADRTVNPANANEIVKQWLDLHHLPATPMAAADVDGYPRQVWWNADGETVVESYTITNMAHGAPLGIADNDERYGAQGAFLIEAGISSSHHIANFFGLTDWINQAKESSKQSSKQSSKESSKPSAKEAAATVAAAAPVFAPVPEITDVLWARPASPRRAEPPRPPGRKAIDVGAIIARALTAAGLMK